MNTQLPIITQGKVQIRERCDMLVNQGKKKKEKKKEEKKMFLSLTVFSTSLNSETQCCLFQPRKP